MRRVLWVSLGFFLSCLLHSLGLTAAGIFACAVLALTAVCLRLRHSERAGALTLLMAAGFVLGLIWCAVFHGCYIRPVSYLDGSVQDFRLHAMQYGVDTDYGTCVDGRTQIGGMTYHVRAYLDDAVAIKPGDRIHGEFLLRVTTEDGAKGAGYHRSSGIYLLAYQQQDVRVLPGDKGLLDYPAELAGQIRGMLEVFFPKDTCGFAKALLLGETDGLSYSQNTALKLSGIRHVVAVSGLHVSVLFALVSTVTFKKRWLKALLGLPVLLVFAAMAGFSPSVNRACLMCALMLLSGLTDREYDGPTALATASLVLMIANPMVVTSAAFQLSVGCVAGIFLFQSKLQNRILAKLGADSGKGIAARLKRWFAGSVSISISAMVFSLPLSSFYFGTVSLVGVLSNLLTLWVVSIIFCGILAVCILGLVSNGGALLLAKAVSVLIRYVWGVAKVLSRFPLAAVYTQSVYITLWVILLYGLLAVTLIRKKSNIPAVICIAATGLCIALLASWLEPMTDAFRMTVLDVGQGQSILLQWDGHSVLVDCGGDDEEQTADLVAQTLLSQGINCLDALIVTHTDKDHAGAVDYLLTRIDAKQLYYPLSEETVDPEAELLVPHQTVTFSTKNGELTIFGPISAQGGNENSLCVLFEGKNCAILITGDREGFGERMLMSQNILPKVDVLVAGHHGSSNATTAEFLERIRPDTVIISAGEGNVFGFPNPELLARLERFGCDVLRTDRSGTIVYRR